ARRVRVGSLLLQVRRDELFPVPVMADTAGIGRGINPRTPIGPAGPGAGCEVRVLPGRKGGRFLHPDHVIFKAEQAFEVLLVLEMAGEDAGTIVKGKEAGGSRIV